MEFAYIFPEAMQKEIYSSPQVKKHYPRKQLNEVNKDDILLAQSQLVASHIVSPLDKMIEMKETLVKVEITQDKEVE